MANRPRDRCRFLSARGTTSDPPAGVGVRKRATESALKEERGARAKAEDVSRRLAFVVGASQLLATHLDPEGALDSLVRLAVPTLAELCVIDLQAGGGQLRRAAVAHA